MDLAYRDQFKTQMLVYPNRSLVYMPEEKLVFLQGYQNVRTSLFDDPMAPVGVRQYVSGDPFQHIHWKASARTQELQTKVFEPSASYGWLIVLNIAVRFSINAQLEEMIRQTAYLIDYALRKNIPFSLAVNVRTFDQTPFYYLKEGSGREHRQKALELLAMLSSSSLVLPSSHMLNYLASEPLPSAAIMIGEMNQEENSAARQFQLKGTAVFKVETILEKGVMKEWNEKQLAV